MSLETIIQAHFDAHAAIMAEIKKRLPQKKMFKEYDREREYSLSDVFLDSDGMLTVKYSRYAGCGDYDYETEYPRLEDLFA